MLPDAQGAGRGPRGPGIGEDDRAVDRPVAGEPVLQGHDGQPVGRALVRLASLGGGVEQRRPGDRQVHDPAGHRPGAAVMNPGRAVVEPGGRRACRRIGGDGRDGAVGGAEQLRRRRGEDEQDAAPGGPSTPEGADDGQRQPDQATADQTGRPPCHPWDRPPLAGSRPERDGRWGRSTERWRTGPLHGGFSIAAAPTARITASGRRDLVVTRVLGFRLPGRSCRFSRRGLPRDPVAGRPRPGGWRRGRGGRRGRCSGGRCRGCGWPWPGRVWSPPGPPAAWPG